LAESDYKGWTECPAETALLPQPCVVCILRVFVVVKAGLKTVSPCAVLSCCFKGAHLTLNLSIESTSLLHHYAARLVPNMSDCTPTAFDMCLYMACLPANHGDRKSWIWRVTWPSGPRLTQASSISIKNICMSAHELEVQGRQDAGTFNVFDSQKATTAAC